ncbi:MAG: glyoxylate/hydroxypyruvate reductase A [Burkholderiaceae bacterium]|nr:glyoxylate/hydroxypyruvate reductase A [Burkholderiaceae bacterium]
MRAGIRVLFHFGETKPEPWLAGLRAALPQADVQLWQPGAPSADYAVVWAPPQQLLDEQTRLRAFFNMGAGVDALLALRLPAGVPVVRLDDAGMSVQMAEFVCHAVIRHFRELDACEQAARQVRWTFRKPRERADFPVGVMGLGVLGRRVAAALQAFEFPVNGWSREPKKLEGIQMFAGAAQMPAFLAASRVLVNLLPLTVETRDILNRNTLSQLQAGGYLINVARGAHLVEADLLALIDEGHLAGAALDVFREEPLPPGHPFWTHPAITVTPHMSARTLRNDSIAQISGKILALERGEPVAGMVDPARGY